ncbi:hypothetical protein [Thermaerobacillus caldiproteolyticus]|uniref:hypothetical protein n=1 Tax=Thermaerobacillus caldiproteolyticus TaxID=247480 RepID=UPI0015EB4217|nr:hypothetical protein [Anoxybacillus caldiproteolyticus]QPA31858.1 hypothetical protein ISX45_02305 [Anoxybacillus caldiproteolyticus]
MMPDVDKTIMPPHFDGQREKVINGTLAIGSDTAEVRVEPIERKHSFEAETVKVNLQMEQFCSMKEGTER